MKERGTAMRILLGTIVAATATFTVALAGDAAASPFLFAEDSRTIALASTSAAAPASTGPVAPEGAGDPRPDDDDASAEDDVFKDRPKRLPPFFWYEVSQERDSRFFMLMMLWWQAENPDRSYQALFPLYYSRLNKHTGGRTVAGPLFYWYASPRSTAGYIPPVYVERGKNVSRTGIPPFFWYGRVRASEEAPWETTSYLFPFYLYDERAGRKVLATPIGGGWGTKDDWQGLVGPYYWRRTHTETLRIEANVLFPVFWRLRTPERSTFVAGPVFRSTREVARGTKRVQGVFPFFYRRTSPGGSGTTITPFSILEKKDPNTRLLVTPLGGYSVAPGRATVVAGPWIDSVRDGERFSALFPVFFRGSGRYGAGTQRYDWAVAGPYFQRSVRERGEDGQEEIVSTDRALLPLFWYGRDREKVSFVSPVAFFQREEDGDFRGLFGPFYRSWSSRHQSWFLFPGFWYHRSPTLRTFGAAPFYYARSERRNAVAAGLFPIVFFHDRSWTTDDGRPQRERNFTLVPLVHWNERPGHLTVLSPLYVQVRRPHDRRTMAAFLWWDHETADGRNLTFLPFFHFARDGQYRRLLTPVGGYAAAPGYHRSIWGPVYRLRDDDLAIREDVVFPFFWNLERPGKQVLVAGPYYRKREGKEFSEGILPLWYHSSFPGSSQTILFPLFMAQRDKIEGTRTVFTPLGGWWIQDEPRAYRVLAPLVYRASGPHKRQTVLFPFLWYDWDRGRQTVVVPPFYTRRSDRELAVGLFPAFWYRRTPGETLLLSPGVFHRRDGDRRSTWVLPLLYGWTRDDERSAGIAGPWWWSRSRTREDDYWRALFPLYLQSRKGENALLATPFFAHSRTGKRTLTGVPALPFFGVATRENDEGKVVSVAALAGPVYWRHAPSAGEAVVAPFFWHQRGHGRSRTTLLPVFHHWTDGKEWNFVSAGFGAGGGRPDRAWWWVLNSWYARDGARRHAAFLPLAWYEQSPARTSLVTPIFFHQADHAARVTTTIAPLFFRRTGPDRNTWAVFPFAYGDTDHATGVTSGGVVPFAFWQHSKESSLLIVPPLLTFRQRRGENSLAVYGPLVDVKTGDRRTVALIPLFRYQRDEAGASFASLPFFWWIKRPDGNTRGFVGLGYWNTETGTRVFPPYARFQRRNEKGEVRRSTEIAFPFYLRSWTPRKEIVVVPPFYRIKRADGTRVHGVAPFWNEELGHGTHRWSVLGDLVAYDRIGRQRRLTILFGFHKRLKPLPPREPRPAMRPHDLQAWLSTVDLAREDLAVAAADP